MPSLRDMLTLICRHAAQQGVSIGEQCARDLELEIRRAWPSERVYIAPPDSRRDPARAEAIRQAAARLPTGVVVERFGISRQAVYKHQRKK